MEPDQYNIISSIIRSAQTRTSNVIVHQGRSSILLSSGPHLPSLFAYIIHYPQKVGQNTMPANSQATLTDANGIDKSRARTALVKK